MSYLTLYINKLLNNHDLEHNRDKTTFHDFSTYWNLEMGVEHYRLLGFLSHQIPSGSVVYDIGTSNGYSAVALADNPNINVITYDIVDCVPNEAISYKKMKNVTGRIKNCLSDIDELLKSPFIFLDTAHEGDFEREIMDLLIQKKYRGILIADDIHLNQAMWDWWNWIPLKKVDISPYGHHSGTGLVIFDESYINVIVS